MKTRTLAITALLLALAADASAGAPREISVAGTRIHVGDVVQGAPVEEASVDLGPAPALGGARVVTRADVMTALGAKKLPTSSRVADSVRVVRRSKRYTPAELDALVLGAAEGQPLGRGVTLAHVRAERALEVAEGWTHMTVEIPKAPKKAGVHGATATASFLGAGNEVFVRVVVPISLAVSEDGARYDAPRGAPVTLVVRRNLIEVRVAGVTEADADVGDPVSVQLRPSGRVLSAKLLSKDEALAVEGRP